MFRRMKEIWSVIVLYGIVAGLVLTLSACTGASDVVDNLLCRPTARIPCINAPDHAGNNAGQ